MSLCCLCLWHVPVLLFEVAVVSLHPIGVQDVWWGQYVEKY